MRAALAVTLALLVGCQFWGEKMFYLEPEGWTPDERRQVFTTQRDGLRLETRSMGGRAKGSGGGQLLLTFYDARERITVERVKFTSESATFEDVGPFPASENLVRRLDASFRATGDRRVSNETLLGDRVDVEVFYRLGAAPRTLKIAFRR